MKAKICWGIIGTGRIARSFVSEMRFVGNGRVEAVASRSVRSAEGFAREFGIGRSFGSYSELLVAAGIDAVYIATPHSLHMENASAAFDAGKAVLCEKPLAVSAAECGAMIARASASRCYMMEGMWTYFLPAVRKALEWVRAGRIGRIRHVQADFGYPQRPYDPERREYAKELRGGCLLELGIYPIAFAWLFNPEEPGSMRTVARFAPNGVEDDVTTVWEYSDSTATLGASFRCKLRNWAYVIGEEGYIAIPDFWRAREAMHFRLDECVEHYREGRESLGFDHQIASVGDDILAGRLESDTVPLAASLKFQELIERIRQSVG